MITTQPSDQLLIISGMQAIFTIIASSESSLTYQWKRVGGLQLPSGASGKRNASLIISNVMEKDEGLYQCAVSNAAGVVTSSSVTLTVCEYKYHTCV